MIRIGARHLLPNRVEPIILAQTGLGDDTPETMAFYTSLLEKYSPWMVLGSLADLHAARHMYLGLLAEQKKAVCLHVTAGGGKPRCEMAYN